MMRVVKLVLLAAGAVILGGGDCGGGTATAGCARDTDCMTGAYCRNADGLCYSAGFCESPVDCSEQSLVHTQCAGSWNCASNACAWHCSVQLPGMGEACGSGGACSSGLTCLRYYGIAGPSGPVFTSCEKACSSSADCGAGTTCVNIADGPGQVCRVR